MLILISVVVGALLAFSIDWYIPVSLTSYVAIIILAALDSIFGAFRSSLEKKFDYTIFITGLLGNSLIAAFLMFVGKKLGADLYLAAVLVFGTRMFQNFASIRRFYINKIIDKKHKRDEKRSENGLNFVKSPINNDEI